MYILLLVKLGLKVN